MAGPSLYPQIKADTSGAAVASERGQHAEEAADSSNTGTACLSFHHAARLLSVEELQKRSQMLHEDG